MVSWSCTYLQIYILKVHQLKKSLVYQIFLVFWSQSKFSNRVYRNVPCHLIHGVIYVFNFNYKKKQSTMYHIIS